jgi:hypothetical protein
VQFRLRRRLHALVCLKFEKIISVLRHVPMRIAHGLNRRGKRGLNR